MRPGRALDLDSGLEDGGGEGRRQRKVHASLGSSGTMGCSSRAEAVEVGEQGAPLADSASCSKVLSSPGIVPLAV